MPHPLRTLFLPAALAVLGAACSAALSEPAHARVADVPLAPTLTINPTAATFNAGGAGRTFDATLLNTTATLSWSLSPVIGGLSATTGVSTTYTPPATMDATTIVTLTVSGAGRAASARLTVQPATGWLISVTPATGTTWASGQTLGFDADLTNTTGTITWSLSPAVGGISPASGAHVTYTPPASVSVVTPVTLTATRGSLTDQAVITVYPAPTLTVTPPTASTTAGGSTIGFDAALSNTTGTIAWSLSDAIGSVQPGTGTHVTYTPPASVDADTVVTLTATKGTLSDTAVITVRKPGAPPPPNVVNHTNWDPGAIPTSYLTLVRTKDILFQHKSVGYNTTHGMQVLAGQYPARYGITLVGWQHGGTYIQGQPWTADTPPATWFDTNNWAPSGSGWGPTTGALANSENGHSTCASSKPIAFDQTMRGQSISYSCPGYSPGTYNDSNVSGEYGRHVHIAMMKYCFEEIWDASGNGTYIFNTYYRPTMEALIRDYPAVAFVWMTLPLPFVQGQTPSNQSAALVAVNFNAALRSYIAANGGFLYDVADVEGHELNGDACYDAGGNPGVCRTWANNASDPHMSATGEVHLAYGLWSMLARVVGYSP